MMAGNGGENKILLCSAGELHLSKTFECGQCFRWNLQEDGSYLGVAMGYAARLVQEGNDIYIITDKNDYGELWSDYFDLSLDYKNIRKCLDSGEYFKRCSDFGAGIRILRQEFWEALCSFIISQCNNIPRIKKIVETFCSLFGEEISFQGNTLYTFPTAETVAKLEIEDLAPLKCGYRAQYIISAARKVASGEVDFTKLLNMDTAEAQKALMGLNGVGAKVANCTVLFGLHKMDAFPVDVWMARALKEHFPEDFEPECFGQYAGLAQQYIFYYARSGGF